MAYTINLTDGTIFATIPDGTINNGSSLTLVGKNYAGYGEFLDENFIKLLENGSNTTAPGSPLIGQLWWDKASAVMKVYNGTTFKVLGGATASSSQPTSAIAGDLWFDTVNSQLKCYTGTTWLLIGPASTAGQGTVGAIVETIIDNIGNPRNITTLYAGNVRVATVSNYTTFTPASTVTGFATIKPGIQLSSSVSGALLQGTAADSELFDGLDSAQFLRSDANDTTTGVLTVQNDGGFLVVPTTGTGGTGKLAASGQDVIISNTNQNGNLRLQVNDGGVLTTVLEVTGSTSGVAFPTAVSVGAGIINAAGNGVGNIGSASGYFNTVFAKATSAQYADVAERFAADEILDAGTVVELGGSAEITKSRHDLSDNVFGVISTRAAYLMNSGAGDDSTHPPVAMTGRVPVKVIGQVAKGDRLVSAGNGLARVGHAQEITPFNVVGRALSDKITDGVGVVEAIVAIK
jgi:hypothetical protein